EPREGTRSDGGEGQKAGGARVDGGPGGGRNEGGEERGADDAVPEHGLARGEVGGDELVHDDVRRVEDGAPGAEQGAGPHGRRAGATRRRGEHEREACERRGDRRGGPPPHALAEDG